MITNVASQSHLLMIWSSARCHVHAWKRHSAKPKVPAPNSRRRKTQTISLLLETSTIMATLVFQRAGWSLQISRTSRTFAVSFTTALPRRQKPRHLAETSNGLHSSRHRSSPSTRHSTRPSRQDSARSIFTSTKVYQEQQAQRSSTNSAVRLLTLSP